MGKNSDKKRKQPESASAPAAAAAPAPAEGFALFGAKKDAELGGLFSAAAALALPTPAKKAKVVKEVEEKKEKKGKKEKVEEKVEEVKEVKEVKSDDETMEVDSGDEAEAGDETIAVDDHDDEEHERASDAESDISLTHESVKKNKKKSKSKPYVPPNESKEDRDRRTVFVGNVDITVAKNKSAQTQLRAHLLTFAPSAKIESVRFRSVAFGTPTSGNPDVDEKEATRRKKREQERAAQWRATQAAEGSTTGGAGNRRGDDEVLDKSKSFIDSKGKRKVAFIKGEFHSDAASCNAYVVFAYPHPDRPKNVAPILDPFEAVEKVLAANLSTFMDRTIRVDRVRLPSAVALEQATNALGKRDAWLPAGTDPKKSLFVGGLDYAAKDEDVRAFFESLVVAERGQPETGRWVTEVRIVRDKDTQLGKGFGYVHFVDRESVDEMISLPSAKLKFAKKPLRVQPCKTLPAHVRIHGKPADGAKDGKDKAGKDGKDAKGKPADKKKALPAGPIPRGNPALGEKIKDLSKEERKVAKATDAERQARRLAKKKLKVAKAHMETGAVKLAATKAEKKRTDKKVTAKKGRVRSSHALSKMKGSRK